AVRVVGRREVAVVALLAARHLEGDVRDHLVGAHVRRGARAALDDADRELVVELPVDHALRGAVDEVGAGGIQHAQLLVRPRRGLLDHGERRHELGIDRDGPLGDVEVLLGAQGVNAPVGVCGDLPRAQRIGFGTRLRGFHEAQGSPGSRWRSQVADSRFRENASSRSSGLIRSIRAYHSGVKKSVGSAASTGTTVDVTWSSYTCTRWNDWPASMPLTSRGGRATSIV